MVESVIQIKSEIMINVDVSVKILKNIMSAKKFIYENGKYLPSIIDNSVIMCDEITEETKTIPTNFNEEKKTTYKTKNLYILLTFFNYHSIIDSC